MSGPRAGGDGGPAFPTHKDISVIAEGMTLRDYFAAQALARIPRDPKTKPSVQAAEAYAMADAMLAERAK